MKTLSSILLLILSTLTAVAWAESHALQEPVSESTTAVPGDPTRAAVLMAASAVIAALQARDGVGLAALSHPEKGVRFSPYSSVDPETEMVFGITQLKGFWDDPHVYKWGVYDGSGDPIELTPLGYYKKFIMDRDFTNPTRINIDDDHAYGNTINNAETVYPNGTRIEFYITPSDADAGGLDWAALRLVFEPFNGRWYLVAVIHDQWTT
jgi:hypothetical protein